MRDNAWRSGRYPWPRFSNACDGDTFARPPELDIKTGHLLCRMNWWGAERDLTTCVALSDDEPDLIVITVMI